MSSLPEKVHLKCTFPCHTHIPTAVAGPGKGAHTLFPDKPRLSSLAVKGGGKSLFDNGAPKGINMVPLFIDPRLDNPTATCSIPFRLWKNSIYSCPVLGFSAPLIFPALCLSHTLPLGRWWFLTGLWSAMFVEVTWWHWNCFSVFPRLSFAFWLYPLCLN